MKHKVVGYHREPRAIAKQGFIAGHWVPGRGYMMLLPPRTRGRKKKITDPEVRATIRAEYQEWLRLRALAKAMNPRALGKKYGVSSNVIAVIGQEDE